MADTPNPWDILPYFRIKSSDEPKTVDTNQDDSELGFLVLGGIYYFQLSLIVASGTAIKCQIRGDGPLLNFTGQAWRTDSGTGNLVFENTGSTVTNIAGNSAFYWFGKVIVPEGLMQVQWSRNTASGTSTVSANSWFHIKQVG